MGILSKSFNEAISKGKLGNEVNYIPFFKTGIDIFDYINGEYDKDGNAMLGIQGGRILMDCGKSGCGKTTKIIQMAIHIAEMYEESDIWHYDYERSTSKNRIMNLAKNWSEEDFEEKYHLFQKNISVETIYRAAKEIESIKMEHYDEIKIDSGSVDKNGKPIFILPPTIMIVDSVALLAPEEIEDDDELKGSMGATAIAKANTNVFKRILSPIENANIIVMLINHITAKIEIGPVKTKADLNFLKQDESLPGGRGVTYLTNTLTKLETGSKLEPDKELGIKGFYLSGILAKARSAESGLTFKMVFNQKEGIDNILTNFVNLKDLGRITGAGRSFKLDTCPDIKFSLKEFKNKYLTNKELRKAFDKAVDEEYSIYISEYNPNKKNNSIKDEELEEIEKDYNEYEERKKILKGYELVSEDEEFGKIYEKDGLYYIINSDTGELEEIDIEMEEE